MINRFTKVGISFFGMFASCFISASSLLAVPANPNPVKYTQPDGTEISVIITGDERGRETYTLDGNLLMMDNEGFLTYASVGNNGLPEPSSIRANNILFRKPLERYFLQSVDKKSIEEAVEKRARERAEKRALGDAPKYIYSGTPFPAKGEPHALVVLIEYPDQKFSMENPSDFFNTQLNGDNYNLYCAKGSAREYFIENSKGLFRPTFDVLGPVMMKNEMSYYGDNDKNGDDQHPDDMLLEACEELSKTHDLSIYDHDGDGYIDNVFMIYAGYGENDTAIKSTVWPHSAELETDFKRESPLFNGVKVNRYGCTCEMKKAYERPDGIGTFVHEFGHVLGLPDLYNTWLSSSYTPGYWSVMDRGSYNNNGITPCNYSSFERYSLNWIEPERFYAQGLYSLPELNETNKAFLIPTEKPDEFFLLENRQQQGYDEYLPHHGMLVWHIDFNQDLWDRNVVNNTRNHQYVDLVEADGKTGSSSADGDPFPGSSRKTFFGASSTPALTSWAKEKIPFELFDITENNNEITFNVIGDFSSVDEIISGNDVKFNLKNGILSGSFPEPATVFDINGRLVGSVSVSSSLPLSERGLYIIRVGEQSYKILY